MKLERGGRGGRRKRNRKKDLKSRRRRKRRRERRRKKAEKERGVKRQRQGKIYVKIQLLYTYIYPNLRYI